MRATDLIAPTWPLDQSIAVNPWWKFKEQPYLKTAAELKTVANVNGFASSDFFLALFQQGRITQSSLKQAAARVGVNETPEQLVSRLQQQQAPVSLTLFSAQVDNFRDVHYMRWQEEIVHQISQFCAAHFQSLRPMLGKADLEKGAPLYAHWLDVTRVDYGLSIVLSAPKLRKLLNELPSDPEETITKVQQELDIAPDFEEAFALSCLYDIHGWASWVAYREWQNHTPTGDSYFASHVQQGEMRELLAIRMAWEWLVFTYLKRFDVLLFERSVQAWQKQWLKFDEVVETNRAHLQVVQVWQLALEIEYQLQLESAFKGAKPAEHEDRSPWLQAVFCIDVRSEVIRRALESQHEGIETKGFAGFFGVPLAYQPQGSAMVRSQTPGLLSPALRVEEALERHEVRARVERLNKKARIQTWAQAAPSAFSMVESMGLAYAPKLLRGRTLSHVVNDLSHVKNWRVLGSEDTLAASELADIAVSVITAMSFDRFAPLVLLVGHGSQSCNNLQAAALDCGACCGQSGEVNSRVLAQILNNVEVRHLLRERGMQVPAETRFVPALHNTTTDDIELLDELPQHDFPLPIKDVLGKARALAQRERLVRFEPEKSAWNTEALDKLLRKRAHDWSQQRPEWGLADNAAFIMAPRTWTRGINLEGRTFLHDYHAEKDENWSVLTLLMTAPMVVGHWINMQYNLSVTEPLKFGSGNKVLHNAVGGSIGVFEGNGGDLRIGLAKQSVFDGERWLHTPQRLTVVIAAPQAAIAKIIEQHPDLESLINNDWIHLLQWQQGEPLMRFYQGAWQPNSQP
ncbi:MAG: hypothetical protein HLUCCO02_10480 [Idiomarinaceae bacterium HL-53]|nr:MAG: hypothetical protein HLUCCO02_10480 [Idiomarinaceae bacterium HL-53]CUS49562.1 hypothetical protein Ga0003345_2562 [Idiomarinaceae bacterium HL-53]